MRFALGILVSSLVLISCGTKPGPGTSIPQSQDFEVVSRFILDGDAQFELEKKHFDDFTANANCIQLVRRATVYFVEFSKGACSSVPQSQVQLVTSMTNGEIYLNEVTIGTWDTAANQHRILQLCSGPYKNLCHYAIDGNSLTNVISGL